MSREDLQPDLSRLLPNAESDESPITESIGLGIIDNPEIPSFEHISDDHFYIVQATLQAKAVLVGDSVVRVEIDESDEEITETDTEETYTAEAALEKLQFLVTQIDPARIPFEICNIFSRLGDSQIDPEEYLILHSYSERIREELINAHRGFIHHLVLKYDLNGFDTDDLIQEAHIALSRSIELFNPRKGVKFISYAGQSIHNAIVRYIDRMRHTVKYPTKHLEGGYDNEIIKRTIDMLQLSFDVDIRANTSTEDEAINNVIEKSLITELKKIFPEKEFDIVFDLLSGYTISQIASKLNLSNEAVRKCRLKACDRIRDNPVIMELLRIS